MRYPSNIREEELKNRVADDFFGKYGCNDIIKNIDFAVRAGLKPAPTAQYLLWAEAKKNSTDIIAMLAQLVLTIGKARTFNEVLPPKFLGCFDCEKIAFIPYADIQDVFHQNDFNWNVAPSNHNTREFKQIYKQIDKIINNGDEHKTYCFNFERDEKSLKLFILKNFMLGGEISKIRIDKNNFISVYAKWRDAVMPTIQFDNWSLAKKHGIIDGDFYLADLLSAENKTLKEKLFVVLRQTHYEMNQHKNEFGLLTSSTVNFTDKQKAHNTFWAIYERPPREAYWDYIIERRDLLVPQDIRERKGSFFTPKIWVELSQKYITDVLGENWQEEYYVWDCAAGTGNLLAGLTNKYNIWASTDIKADVDVMHDRIENGANLLKEHCFQFDFLNDDFSKLPQGLRKIIDDPKKRKKLVVYINPPYAEHGNRTTFAGEGEHKAKVSTTSKVYNAFQNIVGTATRELYAQFFLRIYKDIPNAKLASFSTLKIVNSQNFIKFRNYFQAKFLKGFICKANTFDNVNGSFPIGFTIWDTEKKEDISKVIVDIICSDVNLEHYWKEGKKSFYAMNKKMFISDWLRKFYDKQNEKIGYLILPGVDMQQQGGVYITSQPTESDIVQHKTAGITRNNLMEMSVYFAVRYCIEHTWLNNQDQFLYPNSKWKTDDEFQNDCLAYSLFHGKNNISSKHGTNHWIPFIEWDVEAHDKFDSHFMTDFIDGKVDMMLHDINLFCSWNVSSGSSGGGGSGSSSKRQSLNTAKERKFSRAAYKVFKAGGELWKYYHVQTHPCPSKGGEYNVNASLYDIREHFQGRNAQGKMNTKSDDEKYNELIGSLRTALKELARKIEPKVYEYGFLRG
ncbi:hypothetical protein R83H12_01113 [Fibrobacteria bacterium R8-3-H12]